MKHILITGGSGFLGREIVKGFLSERKKVTFTTTSNRKGVALCDLLGNHELLNFEVVTFENENDINEFVKNNRNKKFTHLINNARSLNGLSVDNKGYADESGFQSEYFMAVVLSYLLSVGFKGSLESIVNISSMYGVVPPNKSLYEDGYRSSPIQYGLAKAAQIQLSKELAVRFSEQKIRVNTVSFGGIEGRVNDGFKKRYANLCPQGRMLTLEEIFPPISFLVSSGSKGVTGHNLIVDGGWSVW